MSILIKGATVISSKQEQITDVLIENGEIKEVGLISKERASRVIDASGLHLLPGVLDPQVHFRDPGMEWKEDLYTGSKAAVSGGVTSFFEMPNTIPNTITEEVMAAKKERASERCLANYNFFIGATADNVEVLNNVENVCGIKIFMGSSTGNLLVEKQEDLENIFSNGSRLIAVHAENEAILKENKLRYTGDDVHLHSVIRSPEAALAATKIAANLSIKYQRRLHILHLTTKQEVAYLREAKKQGPISVEVCPQHFILNAPDIYDQIGTYAQMNPPIRSVDHGNALWNGILEGVIDFIATDHAPHTHEEKKLPYGKAPAGMPGVETSLPLMLDRVNQGLCTLQQVVAWQCENPCLFYRVKNKGFIREGFDADLVLVDMKKQKTIKNGELNAKVNWSPYNGRTTKGWPIMTFVNGNLVYQEGEFFEEHKGKEVIIDESLNPNQLKFN